MTDAPSTAPFATLIRALETAVQAGDPGAITGGVVTALRALPTTGGVLDERVLAPVSEGYGRRLLHRDAAGRFTVVVMTWGPGQGTPIHDHSGLWCVECVHRGRVRVTSYSRCEARSADLVRFAPETQVLASVGEAGALIPPFDDHVIENPFEAPAATLHVYGGEMQQCSVFEPVGDGWHRRRVRALRYTD